MYKQRLQEDGLSGIFDHAIPGRPAITTKTAVEGALLQVILNEVRGYQSTKKLSKGVVEIVQEVLKHRGDLAQQADHGLSQDIQEQPTRWSKRLLS